MESLFLPKKSAKTFLVTDRKKALFDLFTLKLDHSFAFNQLCRAIFHFEAKQVDIQEYVISLLSLVLITRSAVFNYH